MLSVDSSSILRIAIFSGFVGFVLFCASYATQVWLRRNKGNLPGSSRAIRVGAILIVVGLLGVCASWALNHFADRNGIVDGGALFVVHARRDANITMTRGDEVAEHAVLAEYHPPTLGTQLQVIDSQIGEAGTRVEALRARPLEIDPALLQRQAQQRAQIAQQLQFQVEFDRAYRELGRSQIDAATRAERERMQLGNEISAARAALQGLQPQLLIAAGQLGRVNALRKHGFASGQLIDERTTAVLSLKQERARLETSITALLTRIALLDQQSVRESANFAEQLAIVTSNMDATRQSLTALAAGLADLAEQIDQDRLRARTRLDREVQVAQSQVATLTAERGRAVAAQQIIAPFAGRVVYRHTSPGLVPDGAPVLALSTGTGFEAKILIPESEVASIAGAGTVMFAMQHPVLKRYFQGNFRSAETAATDPGRVLAVFDVQLPQDAIGLLGSGRDVVKVNLLWRPWLLDDMRLRASLVLLVLGILTIVVDRLRATIKGTAERHPMAKSAGSGPGMSAEAYPLRLVGK